RDVRRQPRHEGPEVPDALRHLRGRLRPGPRAPLLGTRRIYVPGRQGTAAGAGPLHDPLPLLLRRAPRGSVRPPHERPRPRDVRLGAGLQPLRPLLEEPRAPRPREAAPVLRRPPRRVLPEAAGLLNFRGFAARVPRSRFARAAAPGYGSLETGASVELAGLPMKPTVGSLKGVPRLLHSMRGLPRAATPTYSRTAAL